MLGKRKYREDDKMISSEEQARERKSKIGGEREELEMNIHGTDGSGMGEMDQDNMKKYRIGEKTKELLAKGGIKFLFPIQEAVFDLIYDKHDIIGRDITGSGKTLGFALPLTEKCRNSQLFGKNPLPLILTLLPTRELAVQVHL